MTLSSFSHLAPATSVAAVVAVNFELVRGTETQVLDELLPQVKRESVALDLSAVERIDAAGIATLITLYCSAVEAGTDFSVVAPSQHVSELLRIVGLESILLSGTVAGAVSDSRQRLSGCPEISLLQPELEFSAA